MKEAQKMIIIGLLVLALLPGFIGVASAAPKIHGQCYVDDGSHLNIEKTYSYRNLPGCTIQYCMGGTCYQDTSNRRGIYQTTITQKTWTVEVIPPEGWSWTGPSGAYSVTPTSKADFIDGLNFWLTPLTSPSVVEVSIPSSIEPGGSVQGTVTIEAGSEQIDYAKLKYSGDHNRFQVIGDPPKVTIPPFGFQTFQVTINGAPILKTGDYSFNIDVWDMNYLPDGTDRLVMSIPVTETVPDLVSPP